MGKRKERRLAAMGATNRRVKLDLFAEPSSGDVGGSSAQDEGGGVDDPKNSAGLPNSPSSSGVLEILARILFLIGKRPENPLLLLGQYSDDELDEESREGLDDAIVENSSAGLDDQVKVASGQECEDIEINGSKDLASQKVEQLYVENCSASSNVLPKLEDNGSIENDSTDLADLQKETDLTEQISISATSDVQVTGDINSGWKMVLHEDSNQYYYWNTVTGKTSWEVPNVLVQGTELMCEQNTPGETENTVAVTHKSGSTLETELDDAIASEPSDGSEAANLNCESQETYEHRPEIQVLDEGSKGDTLDDKIEGHDVNDSDVRYCSGIYDSSRQSREALLGDGSSLGADSLNYMDDTNHGGHETRTDISSSLVKHGECLLERLKSLKSSKDHLQLHDLVSKYILEVEIRLFDIKSLSSCGSSLLPFWVHSDRKLKQLEAAMNEEVLHLYTSVQTSEVEATHKLQERIGDDIKSDLSDKKAILSTSGGSHSSNYASILTEGQIDSHKEAYTDGAANSEHVPSIGYLTTPSASDAGGMGLVDEAAIHAETPQTILHSAEDVDMDVDMEVEDAIPSSNSIGGASVPQHLDPSVQHELFAPMEIFGVPPPPDEDWIPPPPPDSEPFPPPPPDEPPENSYPPPPDELPENSFPPPPSDSETVQPFMYTEQYNLSYPESNFIYYGQTNTEVPGSNFYAHAEGSRVIASQPPSYYETVPNMYTGAAPVVIDPVVPVAYYGLQNGTIPLVPVVSSVEFSGLHGESGNQSFDSDQIVSVESHAEGGFTSLAKTSGDVSAVGGENEKAAVKVPSAPAPVQAPAIISMAQRVSMSSIPAVATISAAAAAATATATVTKAESKVLRNKKRTAPLVSTLRSNKKVSSLVDKWKAAKEELHEAEEDEPENAYEKLEEKRQREIEEWRAKQLASREAKNNANFQPLGGDWRERVKRKKAQRTNEVEQTLAAGVANGNEQPDLNELSRDLPSGWQAYWDETSKQVYYGKSATSETTWIRPTTA